MINKISFLCGFLLIVCLLAAGCGKDTDNSPPGDKIIYAPTYSDTAGKAQDTEPAQGSDVADTEPTADSETETQNISNSDPIQLPAEVTNTPVTDDTPDTFAPDEISGIIDLGDALISGETVTGRFVSQQSEKIRLVVTYNCQLDIIGNVTIEYEVGLECYDINCGARVDLGALTLDGVTHTFSTEEIINSTGMRIYIPFTKYVYQSRIGQTACTVDAAWKYNGVYAGTKIDTLSAGAIIMWDAPDGSNQ